MDDGFLEQYLSLFDEFDVARRVLGEHPARRSTRAILALVLGTVLAIDADLARAEPALGRARPT